MGWSFATSFPFFSFAHYTLFANSCKKWTNSRKCYKTRIVCRAFSLTLQILRSALSLLVRAVFEQNTKAFFVAPNEFACCSNEFACCSNKFACCSNKFACYSNGFACCSNEFACSSNEFARCSQKLLPMTNSL